MFSPWKDKELGFSRDLAVIDKFLIVFGMVHRDLQLIRSFANDDGEVDPQSDFFAQVPNSKMDYEEIYPDLLYVLERAENSLDEAQRPLGRAVRPVTSGPSGQKRTSNHRTLPEPQSPSPDPAPRTLTRLRRKTTPPTLLDPANQEGEGIPPSAPPSPALPRRSVADAVSNSSIAPHGSQTGTRRRAKGVYVAEELRRYPAPPLRTNGPPQQSRESSRHSVSARIPALSDSDSSVASSLPPLPPAHSGRTSSPIYDEMVEVESPQRISRTPQRWSVTPSREPPAPQPLLQLHPQPLLATQPLLAPQPLLEPQAALASQQDLAPQPVLAQQTVLVPQHVLAPQPLSPPERPPASPAPAPSASGSASRRKEDSESDEEPPKPPAKVMSFHSYSYLSFR